jgi:threonine dehydrogenase-like Zn-dependent dehydrogenase
MLSKLGVKSPVSRLASVSASGPRLILAGIAMPAKARMKTIVPSGRASHSSSHIGTRYAHVLTSDTYGSVYADGTLAQGGYSSHIRAHEHYVYPIPEKLQTELAAPMLCAGLTAYSPLVRNGVGPGKTVGVIGM